jgi:hypothetical protein
MLPPPFLRWLFKDDAERARATMTEAQIEEAEKVLPGDIG